MSSSTEPETVPAPSPDSGAPMTYEVHVQHDVMVPMRDGCRLATDIYRPAQDGKPVQCCFPVILERTAYDRSQSSRSEVNLGGSRPMSRAQVAEFFVREGYVVVYQDCRGRHASEGDFVKYLSESEDGEDTVRWLTEQSWCNGQVGTKGLSYGAHAQMALACRSPKGLAAMVLDSGGFSNAYQGGIRQGGAFELKQVTWAFRRALEACDRRGEPLVAQALQAEDLHAWFRALPWRPGHSPLRWVPDYEKYLFEQWRHMDFDAYWQQPGIYAAGNYDLVPDIPQVHMSSWYDPYVRTATENYVGLTQRKRSCMQLIMGPWLHGDRNITHCGDVEFGSAAAFDGNLSTDWRTFRRRWFDRWLRGIPNGVEREPRVRLFVMGGGSGRRNSEGRLEHGGRWMAASDWPVPGSRLLDFYLHPEGVLSLDPPPAAESVTRYTFDPRRPVPTIGGSLTSGRPIFEGGAFDQVEDPRFFGARGDRLPLAARPDVIVYQTAALERDTMVIGPIVVTLHVSSDAPDTDFTAKLIDVYPASADYPRGFAMNLTDGILRCRYRQSWERPQLMTSGVVYEIRIECMATANLFKAGHRIRLDISSSNFPKYDVNPNTGESPGEARSCRTATNALHHSRVRASRVALPVVDASAIRPWG